MKFLILFLILFSLLTLATFTCGRVSCDSSFFHLYAQTYPDPAMRNYSPSQMKAIMNFKSTPLILDEERKVYNQVRNRRDKAIREMGNALCREEPENYYRGLKKILPESLTLSLTCKKAERRLDDAYDKLYEDFEPFGNEVKKWPAFARGEEEKLKKGKELIEKLRDVDDKLTKYVRYRSSDSYEICFISPQTFVLNKTYLRTGYNTTKGIHENYNKLLDKLEEADKKAKDQEKSSKRDL